MSAAEKYRKVDLVQNDESDEKIYFGMCYLNFMYNDAVI